MRDGIDNVALREASVPAGKMGREVGAGMENSVWRRDKKSFAVVRSPSEPARCGLVAYCRATDSALASLGMVLRGVRSENGKSQKSQWGRNEQKEFLSLLPVQPMLGFPYMNKHMRPSSE